MNHRIGKRVCKPVFFVLVTLLLSLGGLVLLRISLSAPVLAAALPVPFDYRLLVRLPSQ